jgi:hypothetical protein
MADEQNNTGSTGAADTQDQSSEDTSEHSTSEHGEATSPWAKFTAEELMENCPYTVGLKVIDTSL